MEGDGTGNAVTGSIQLRRNAGFAGNTTFARKFVCLHPDLQSFPRAAPRRTLNWFVHVPVRRIIWWAVPRCWSSRARLV